MLNLNKKILCDRRKPMATGQVQGNSTNYSGITNKYISEEKIIVNHAESETISSLVRNENIIENICKNAVMDTHPLAISNSEALKLVSDLIDKDKLIEKVKKIQIERQIPNVVQKTNFKKHFETIGHNGIIERMCFDNSSKYAFSGGADGTVKIWSIVDGMLIRSLYGHSNMISDLCVSKCGEYIVSVDYQGLLNIWRLDNFQVLHSIQFSSEAIFCEFVYCENTSPSILGNIIIIFADGTVKTVEFDLKEARVKLANKCMSGESIQAICVTDGGRFVICGGWWPFFIIYDTKDLDRLIVAENFRIKTLCAAKNALKFAASSDNQICSYTFYCEGSSTLGNFNKKKSGEGYWKKFTNYLNEDSFAEWLCFLPSLALIAACSDNVIRIFEDDMLILSFSADAGTIYSHPYKDIFAVVGTKLSIYQIIKKEDCSGFDDSDYSEETHSKVSRLPLSDSSTVNCVHHCENTGNLSIKLLFSETVYVNINDCQFSEDGKYFIACDDQGLIKSYSVEDSIDVPEHQFFLKDIDRSIETEDFSNTYDIFRQKNVNWHKVEYDRSITLFDTQMIKIEDLAAKTLEKDKLDEVKFRKMYIDTDPTLDADINPETLLDQNRSDRDTTYIMSEDPVQDLSTSSDTALDVVLRSSRARRIVDSESAVTASSDETDILSDDYVINNRRTNTVNTNVATSARGRRIILSSSSESETDDLYNSKSSIKLRKDMKNQSNSSLTIPNTSFDSSHRILRKNLKESYLTISSDDSPAIIKRKALSSRKQLSLKKRKVNEQGVKLNRKRQLVELSSEGDDSTEECSNSNSTSYVSTNLSHSKRLKSSLHSNTSSKKRAKNSPSNKSLSANGRHNLSNILSDEKTPNRMLRRNMINKEDLGDVANSNYQRSKNEKKKYKDLDELSGADDNQLDLNFEQHLTEFSYQWLATNSIYPGSTIYFNRDSYLEFMRIEQRISYSKNYPKHSGEFSVLSVSLEFVGLIPYLVIRLHPNYVIMYYEYPDSEGIACALDQYEITRGDPVYFYLNGDYHAGLVTAHEEMFAYVHKQKKLKSMLLVKYQSLGIPQIEYSSALKPLFGTSRTVKFNVKPMLDYSLVNSKIEKSLYRNTSDLICDLTHINSLARSLPHDYRSASKNILNSYSKHIK